MKFQATVRNQVLVTFFSLILALPQAIANPDSGAKNTVRLRDRSTCGLFLVQAQYIDGKRRIDDTYGQQVAPLDLAMIKKYAEHVPEKPDGLLVVSGLPIYGKGQREFLDGLKQILKDANLGDIPIRNMPRAGGTGVKRAVEEARDFFWMPHDLQSPIREDVSAAFAQVVPTEAIVLIFSFANYPVHVAIPISVGSTAANSALAIARRSVMNWINRSTGRPWEKPFKEMMISTLFAGIYYTAFHWPEFAAFVTDHGAMSTLLGPANFAASQWDTIMGHGFFFAGAMSGIYGWDQLISGNEAGNRTARRVAPVLTGAVLTFSTPFLIWAATSKEILLDIATDIKLGNLPPLQMGWEANGGEASLVAMGLAGSILWMKPKLLNYVAPSIDYAYYNFVDPILSPLTDATQWLMRKIFRVKEKEKDNEQTP